MLHSSTVIAAQQHSVCRERSEHQNCCAAAELLRIGMLRSITVIAAQQHHSFCCAAA